MTHDEKITATSTSFGGYPLAALKRKTKPMNKIYLFDVKQSLKHGVRQNPGLMDITRVSINDSETNLQYHQFDLI